MAIEAAQENLEKRAISRSTFMVMLGGVFSLLAGLVNQMIIAAYFGAGNDMDAYWTALVIPAYLQAVLLSGLSFVFIPVFVEEETNGNTDAAWDLVGTFFWITTVILSLVAIVGAIFSRQIISITAPGFDPAKADLAARMLSVLMLSVPLSGLSSYTRGIQNARNSFFWPAFGGALNSIGNIVVVVLLTRTMGSMALAWGFVFAIFLQACITVFPVLKHGWQTLIPLTNPRVAEMGKLILPFILFGLLTSGTAVFERYFASVLPSGQLSYLGYAGKISSIYQQLLATGIASAIYPAMAKSNTQSGKDALAQKTIYGLRLTFATALPASLITGAVAIPLVKFLFERGQFTPTDTAYVARVVLIVMLSGVLCRMLSNIIIRTFYVLKDTLTPPIISTISVAVYIAIGKLFADRWSYVGLTYALLVQQGIFVLLLWVSLKFKLPNAGLKPILKNAVTYGLAAVGSFLVGMLLSSYLVFLPTTVNLLLSILASGTLYLVILHYRDREILIPLLEMLGIWRVINLVRSLLAHMTHSRASQ